jgi:O-acetyl-ADP-ribose deacetylase (regulator of RNase III)
MKIIYEKGDLTEADVPVILHGCNAQGVMGSGVAAAIRSKYPQAYSTYKAEHVSNGLRLGSIVWAGVPITPYPVRKWIGNMITQEYFGRDGAKYVSYDALWECFIEVNRIMGKGNTISTPPRNVGMPLIGAGLGGGNWNVISTIIEETSTAYQPIVYTL